MSIHLRLISFGFRSDFIDGTYDAPGRFLKLLPDALTSQGVFVAQADEAPTIHHPAHQYSVHRNRGQFVQHLINVGFQSVREYEEVSGILYSIIL